MFWLFVWIYIACIMICRGKVTITAGQLDTEDNNDSTILKPSPSSDKGIVKTHFYKDITTFKL